VAWPNRAEADEDAEVEALVENAQRVLAQSQLASPPQTSNSPELEQMIAEWTSPGAGHAGDFTPRTLRSAEEALSDIIDLCAVETPQEASPGPEGGLDTVIEEAEQEGTEEDAAVAVAEMERERERERERAWKLNRITESAMESRPATAPPASPPIEEADRDVALSTADMAVRESIYYKTMKELMIDTIPDDTVTRTLFRMVADDRIRRDRLIKQGRAALRAALGPGIRRAEPRGNQRKWGLLANLAYFSTNGGVDGLA